MIIFLILFWGFIGIVNMILLAMTTERLIFRIGKNRSEEWFNFITVIICTVILTIVGFKEIF